jgi:hypothetical protein
MNEIVALVKKAMVGVPFSPDLVRDVRLKIGRVHALRTEYDGIQHSDAVKKQWISKAVRNESGHDWAKGWPHGSLTGPLGGGYTKLA